MTFLKLELSTFGYLGGNRSLTKSVTSDSGNSWSRCNLPMLFHLLDNKHQTPNPQVFFTYSKNGRTKLNRYQLVVATHLKNICQTGNLPQIGMKIKNVWNHQLGYHRYIPSEKTSPLQICLDFGAPTWIYCRSWRWYFHHRVLVEKNPTKKLSPKWRFGRRQNEQ